MHSGLGAGAANGSRGSLLAKRTQEHDNSLYWIHNISQKQELSEPRGQKKKTINTTTDFFSKQWPTFQVGQAQNYRENATSFSGQQLPFQVAYGVTVHKLLGLTLDWVVAHLQDTEFVRGLVFVACLTAVCSMRDLTFGEAFWAECLLGKEGKSIKKMWEDGIQIIDVLHLGSKIKCLRWQWCVFLQEICKEQGWNVTIYVLAKCPTYKWYCWSVRSKQYYKKKSQ